MQDKIIVRGARANNLKNVDVDIPRDRLVVVTGLSGSGKSSLAFDTIYAEGQRRYVESLSAYARQFLGQMDKPDVDYIEGLSPAISIDQKGGSRNPRSTVGTITEIYDYMRLLYARIGHPHCPNCGREITQQTVQEIVDAVAGYPDGSRVLILAALIKDRKGEHQKVFEDIRKAGYVRARVDGDIVEVDSAPELEKYKKHTIEVVIDRIVIHHAVEDDIMAGVASGAVAGSGQALRSVEAGALGGSSIGGTDLGRLSDSVEAALKLGEGVITVAVQGGEERMFSEHFACVYCGISLGELEPRSFSFNSPHGACPACAGLGTTLEPDPELLIPDPGLSLREGAVAANGMPTASDSYYGELFEGIARTYGFSMDTPIRDLREEQLNAILYGSDRPITVQHSVAGRVREYQTNFEGVANNIKRRYSDANTSESVREEFGQYMAANPCPVCNGSRLKPEALSVTIAGRNIVEVSRSTIADAQAFFDSLGEEANGHPSASGSALGLDSLPHTDTESDAHAGGDGEIDLLARTPAGIHALNGNNGNGSHNGTNGSNGLHPQPTTSVEGLANIAPNVQTRLAKLNEREAMIAQQILKEIRARLGFLVDVGLDYLTLNRSAATLAGGEGQRIRLATQIGSGLMGVVYILDEPSIGLHQRDNARLISTLVRLRDLGNTLLVVEHDEDTMRVADHIIDVGPGAGVHGGRIIAEGTLAEIMANPESITGQYLSGKRAIKVPETRRNGNGKKLTIRNARENNLQNVDVDIPLGKLVCVTGVSGSGKSSLINDILYKRLAQAIYRSKARPGAHDAVEGMEQLDKVIDVNQSPIGRTPRSNPATYIGVFNIIRDLFAGMPEAKARGYAPGRFSFNVKGGRCEACQGEGIIKIEMQFLPDIYVPCEVCHGARYNREALEIKYKNKNIAEVLDMTIAEAAVFFENLAPIANKLTTLTQVGLGYMKVGQPATTLSGGEAQRVKLAAELSKRATGRTMYILDEPTTGLHFEDVARLLDVLQRLVDTGNTVLVIEHNLDVIKTADWLIDLGPEGGSKGGKIVGVGTPEQIAQIAESYTGLFLQPLLDRAQYEAAHMEFDHAAADAKLAASLPQKKEKKGATKPRGKRLARPK